MADVVLAVVETDLRLLAAEAKKAEGPMTNLMGILHHSDLPAVKDATERALQKVRNMEHGGLLGVQQALEILSPFSLACETKYAKLACIALSAFQKLLANDAVSNRGRCEIIKALQAAERLSDESVKLRILQASLTIIQNPNFADEQDGVQQLLSLLFRLYVNNKSNVSVHSTAAATIRQAVALIFDHSVMKPRSSPAPTHPIGSPNAAPVSAPTPPKSGHTAGGTVSSGPTASSLSATAGLVTTITGVDGGQPLGREVVPVLLLEEIMGWLGARDGKELGWIQLQQRGGNRVDRTFLLEMLEAVLLQRAAAIHRLPGLVACLKHKVAPAVAGLLDSACDRNVDPNDAADCRLVVRCSAALVRRHHDLAPERAAAAVARLAETAGSVGRSGAAHRWQRFMALQALKPLLADPQLLYRLYQMNLPSDKKPSVTSPISPRTATTTTTTKPTSDQHSSVATATTTITAKAALTTPDGSTKGSADGTATPTGPPGGTQGGVLAIVIRNLHEALRWYVLTSIETPEDDVVAALGNLYLQRAMGARDSVQETEAFGTNLATGSEVVIAHLALEGVLGLVAATEALTDVVVVPGEPGMPSPKLVIRDTPEVRASCVAGLVGLLWRCALAACNTLLARAAHDVLVGLLVRGLQGITFCAGALGVVEARDALLHALCSHTLLPPGEDDVAVLAVAAGAAAGGGGGGGASSLMAGEDRSVGSASRRGMSTTPANNTPTALSPAPTTTPSNVTSLLAGPANLTTLATSLFPPGPPPPTPAPGFLTSLLFDRSAAAVRVVLTPRNIAALRALFALAHRLADALGGSGWLYVVDAVNALDRILASPHTTTAAYLMETASEGDVVGGGLQPMGSTLGPISGGPGAGGAVSSGGAAGGAGGITGTGAAVTGTAVPQPSAAAAAMAESGADDGSTTAQRELRILASAADQLFENTHHMSPEAVVCLLSALAEISHRTLAGLGLLAAAGGGGGGAAAGGTAPGGGAAAPGAVAPTSMGGAAAGPSSATSAAASASVVASSPSLPGPVRLSALNRMVDTLLHNLWRIQDLWGIFLGHVLEALASPNVQVRGAAVDALDRTITSALHPDLHIPDKFTTPLPAPEDALSPASATRSSSSGLTTPFPPFPAAPTSPTPTPPPPPGPSVGTSQGASTPFASCLSTASAAATVVPQLPSTTPAGTSAPPPTPASAVPIRGVQQAAQREDVQHMLLVALDSLYREGGRSPDVRHGLLRISLHVLQHHGDGITRGWVPLLRLLEGVPRPGQGAADVRLGFQVVELLATDYLASSLPKEHIAKALDVIARFAMQDTVLNVSLTAITMLWNVTDHLARSRGTFSRLAAATSTATTTSAPQHPSQRQPDSGGTSGPTEIQPRHTRVAPSLSGPYNNGGNGNSPFQSSMYGGSGGDVGGDGNDAGASGADRQISPAFAAALSFARGVPALPAVGGAARSPWPQPTQPSQPTRPQSQQSQQPQAGSTATRSGAVGVVSVTGSIVSNSTGGGGGSCYPLHDLDESESIAMLMIAFRSLKALSVDSRPEARNAAVRTLFLAVCSHGRKFPPATWRQLFWGLLLELLVTLHRVSANSSVEEAAAVELGKEKGGRSVVMLVHHSRNSEQKQWDETLVLALAGAGKVLRSYLGVLSGLEGWAGAWQEMMQVLGDLLSSGRKGVCMASTGLLTTLLGAHGSGPLVGRDMWRQVLAAVDRGVSAMAGPATAVPLQARAELLACITTLASQLLMPPRTRPTPSSTPSETDPTATPTTSAPTSSSGPTPAWSPDPDNLLRILRWLDRFARYPVGVEDTSVIHFNTIGPIQKAVLGALGGLAPAAAAAGVWPAVLGALCDMLRPFGSLAPRQHAQAVAALQLQRRSACPNGPLPPPGDTILPPSPPSGPASGPLDPLPSSASTTSTSSNREPSVRGPIATAGPQGEDTTTAAPTPRPAPAPAFSTSPGVQEARALSPVWMARIVELLASWYREHVSWQVRVATFPLLVGAMSECMACRHLLAVLPLAEAGEQQQLDELWRAAARGFVSVVQTGLPSINLAYQGQHSPQLQVPHSTWPALGRAFQMFFLAANLPPLAQPPLDAQHALAATLAGAAGPSASSSLTNTSITNLAVSAAAASQRRLSGIDTLLPGQPGGPGGEGSLPPGVPVPVLLPAPNAAQAAADLEITAAVLDCLSETVLSACQHAPVEMRRALVEVLDAGAASLAAPASAGLPSTPLSERPYDESPLPPPSRFSHMCLNKLYVLCSRGQEPPEQSGGGEMSPTARAQLEVAQLALPVLVSRCEAILADYARSEHCNRQSPTPTATPTKGRTTNGHTSSPTPDPSTSSLTTTSLTLTLLRSPAFPGLTLPAVSTPTPAALHDKTRHVLELLAQLRVLPGVSDALLPSRPHLRFWLEAVRAVRTQTAMPPPAQAAAAAAAAANATSAAAAPTRAASGGGTTSLLGGGGGSTALLSSPASSARRSLSGQDSFPSTAAAAATNTAALIPANGSGSTGVVETATATSTSAGGGGGGGSHGTVVVPTGRPSGASFFSRTYSSTGALLSSAMGVGGAASPTPAVRASTPASAGSSSNHSGGGGSTGLDGRPPMPVQRSPSFISNNGMGSGGGSSSFAMHPTTTASGTGGGSAGGSGNPGGAVSGRLQWVKEQPHLVALYGVLCECIASSDPVVRSAVQGMLTAVGISVGLCVPLALTLTPVPSGSC